MKNRNTAIAVALLAAAALVYWFAIRDRGGAPKTGEPPPETTGGEAAAVRVSLPQDLRSAGLDVVVDRDREGALRLEGQVIDELEDPVSGARVIIDSNPPRVAVTGDDGAFFFDKLVGRPYRLVARAENATAGPVTALLTSKSEPVILRTRAANTVEVTVLRADDRRPLAGAAVEIRGLFIDAATTDDRGVATLRGVPPGRYQVAARASGFAPDADRLFVMTAGATHRAELVLRRGAAVSGTVVDAAGAPVAGARVVYLSTSDRRIRAHPVHDAAVTGADGAFRFPALPPGTFRFRADHDELAPGLSEPVTLGDSETTGVVVRLDEGAVIAGVVKSAAGEPVPSAAVRVATGGGRRFQRPRQTFTGDDGRFEMKGLARGEVRLVALGEAATSAAETVDLSTGERRDVELVLALDGAIAGVVIDDAGEPVDGAQVRLLPDFRAPGFTRADIRLRGLSTVITDPGGNFKFTGLDDQTYRIQAAPPGSMLRFGRGARDAREVRAGARDVEIVLPARASISGVVAYSDGDPVTAFTVRVGRGFRGRPTPVSSKEGRFQIGDLEPGSYQLTITGADFGDRSLDAIDLASGAAHDVGTVTVTRGRRISGKVIDGSGPVVGATVTAGTSVRGSGASIGGGRRFARLSKQATTGDDGSFTIGGVGPTALVVVAEHQTRGRSLAATLPATRESTTGLELRLQPPGAIGGVVREGGKPADRARVTAQSQTTPDVSYSVRTGPDGVYRFDILAPDSYLVSARVGDFRSGFASVSKAAEVRSGAVATVDLALDLGDVALTVKPAGAAVNVVWAYAIAGGLSASSLAQLETSLATRSAGDDRRAIGREGEAPRLADLRAGEYTVCLVPFPAELGPRESFEYSERQGAQIPAFCQAATIAASPREQTVEIAVEVPALIEPPAE